MDPWTEGKNFEGQNAKIAREKVQKLLGKKCKNCDGKKIKIVMDKKQKLQ